MKKPNILTTIINNYRFRFYMLTLLGFIMASIMLWGQYLRPRLPRDIPFHLTLFRLILLLFTCLVFVLVLKHLIRPKPSKFILYIYPYLAPYHQLIFQPLYALDYVIRDSLFNITKAIIRLLPYITFPNRRHTFLFYFFLNFIPRLILVILFILDIFYFKKLELMYMYIWLGFIPLAITYVKYILNQTKEDYILYLEPLYKAYPIPKNKEQEKEWASMNTTDPVEYEEYATSIRQFMLDMFLLYNEYNYEPVTPWNTVQKYYTFDDIFEKCDGDFEYLPKDMKDVAERDFYELMPLILILDAFLTDYDITIEKGNGPTAYDIRFNIKRHYPLKYWNIGIYSVYLICWVYILVISLPTFTLSGNELIILTNFQDKLDPITNLIIDNERSTI
jgi:hypothetical protein